MVLKAGWIGHGLAPPSNLDHAENFPVPLREREWVLAALPGIQRSGWLHLP